MAKDLEKDKCCGGNGHHHHHDENHQCSCGGHEHADQIEELRKKLNTEKTKGNQNVVAEGKVVTVEFKVFDTKTNELLEDTKEVGPFFYIQGMETFVPKIEETLEGNKVGFKTTVELSMEEGYGEHDSELVMEMPKSEFADFEDIYVGLDFIADLEGEGDEEDGGEQSFVITDIEDDVVTVDGNHPFAGRDIKFEIEIIGIREASEKELELGEPLFEGF